MFIDLHHKNWKTLTSFELMVQTAVLYMLDSNWYSTKMKLIVGDFNQYLVNHDDKM